MKSRQKIELLICVLLTCHDVRVGVDELQHFLETPQAASQAFQ